MPGFLIAPVSCSGRGLIMNKLLRTLRLLLGPALLILAMFVIHNSLREYHYRDILHQLREIAPAGIVLSLGLTVVSYLLLTLYDLMALRYIQQPLTYGKIALASFVGYVFSYNLTIVGGSAARYRIYSSWGVSTLDTAKIVIFCGLTLWLGLFSVAGSAFVLRPLPVPEYLHLPLKSTQPLGVIFLFLLAGYVLWASLKRGPVRAGGLELPPPGPVLTILQIAIASLDWVLAGCVLYVLLPRAPALSFPHFIQMFMLAQCCGMISQIPGGLGAFEMVALFLLSPVYSAPAVLSVIVVYRIIYYLFPFAVAAGVLVTHELLARRQAVRWLGKTLSQWAPAVTPQAFAFLTFLGGAVLLFSGSLPAEKGRLAWLRDLLPLPIIEVSHFLASLIGMGLLVLARGLQRRLDAAYHLTVVLLVFGVILSLFKGLDYEEAVILSMMLAALLPCRREFHRKSSLFSRPFTFSWIAAILIVLLGSVWLGFFAYKHVEYSNSLWWRFAFQSDAPRFLRASAGVLILAVILALATLLRPAVRPFAREKVIDIEQIRPIVEKSRRTYANLAFLGDKIFFVSETGNAFIMYGVRGQSWVAMGDPVGPQQEWQDLIWQFSETCDRHGSMPVFYEVDGENLPYYADLGLTSLKIGEEGRVPLETFSLEGSGGKHLRYTLHKCEKEGCEFEVLSISEAAASMGRFRDISDAWLEEKSTREKGFSLGFFDEKYLKHFPAAVVRKAGQTLAFANLWCTADKEELSIDLMRHLPDSPEGLMDYLFVRLMQWGRREGYKWFNLGMAPLSGLADRSLARLWVRFGNFVFQHGEHFYNFQGLRKYKEKFAPQWYPKYLVCPGGLKASRVLSDVLSLTSRGIKGAVSK